MLRRARGLLNFPLKLIPIAVFGILLTAAVNIVIAHINYTSGQEELQTTIEDNKEEIWEEISDVIKNSYYSSRQATKIMTLNIENSILHEYPNLDLLESQFDNGKYSAKFYNILKKNIERDDVQNNLVPIPYFTIVGKTDSVLVTFSNSDMGEISKINTTSVFTWDNFADLTPNPNLTKKAFEKIFNKSQDVIFTQTLPFGDNYKYTDYVGMSTLREIYEEKGIMGLRHFSILSPAYITETGDIFGNEDQYYLAKNDNHKLVAIQVISLKTILNNHKEYIDIKIKNNSIEEEYIEKRILHGLITTILISLLLFIISWILIGIHNAESERKIKECGECSKKGE